MGVPILNSICFLRDWISFSLTMVVIGGGRRLLPFWHTLPSLIGNGLLLKRSLRSGFPTNDAMRFLYPLLKCGTSFGTSTRLKRRGFSLIGIDKAVDVNGWSG
jgi:hypothetical protein